MSQPSESGYTGRFESHPAGARRKKKSFRGLLALLLVLLSAARILATGLKAANLADFYLGGRDSLIDPNVHVSIGDKLQSSDQGKTLQVLESGDPIPSDEDYVIKLDDGQRLFYQGHTYQINDKLSTVLVLGIDSSIDPETGSAEATSQADVLLLVGIDTETGKGTILNISRETYAQVNVYSVGGNFIETTYEQISTAFGHSDGGIRSCENTRTAVQTLLYELPISFYVAIDMDGIVAANEAVGGVTVKSLFTSEMPDGTTVNEGELITLHGRNLDRYIRRRSHTAIDSNEARMQRQKQYVTEFSKVVIEKARDDISFPVDLFSSLSQYMLTDLEIPNVTFLSKCFLQNGAHFTYRTLKGTYQVPNGSSMFYPDEIDLFEAILLLYYKQID